MISRIKVVASLPSFIPFTVASCTYWIASRYFVRRRRTSSRPLIAGPWLGSTISGSSASTVFNDVT